MKRYACGNLGIFHETPFSTDFLGKLSCNLTKNTSKKKKIFFSKGKN
jgi:hypothetical protein